jgi:hypothetical protein
MLSASRTVASLVELLVLALVVLVVVAAAQASSVEAPQPGPGLMAGMILGSEQATSTSGVIPRAWT